MSSSEPTGKVLRVMLVDDHELFRDGIASLLNSQPDLQVVGMAADGLEASYRAPALQPDIILLDINMPGMGGLEALDLIRPLLPQATIIMLTVHDEDEKVFSALRAGANGYILKNTNSQDFLTMLRRTLEEGAAISSELTSRVIAEFARTPEPAPANENGETIPSLTGREKEVLGLITEGLADKEIAQRLSISLYTVKSHVRNILSKLNAPNRHTAADMAMRERLIRPNS